MEEDNKAKQRRVVEVEFNEQQDVYLERLRKEDTYGASDAEIIRNVFQEFLKQIQS